MYITERTIRRYMDVLFDLQRDLGGTSTEEGRAVIVARKELGKFLPAYPTAIKMNDKTLYSCQECGYKYVNYPKYFRNKEKILRCQNCGRAINWDFNPEERDEI